MEPDDPIAQSVQAVSQGGLQEPLEEELLEEDIVQGRELAMQPELPQHSAQVPPKAPVQERAVPEGQETKELFEQQRAA